MKREDRSCVGGSIEVNVGARTSGDIVGAMLVTPEEIGVDMRRDAARGVQLGKQRAAAPSEGGDHAPLRKLLGKILG